MAFKKKTTRKHASATPEALFADIRTKKIRGLLTTQGDILRKYAVEHSNSSDVIAELPTGAGKTLVALLIAEWRRLNLNERVVYLCPNKQLVNQVVAQAKEQYGIEVLAFTGSQRDYSVTEKLEYNSGSKIAVTTYHGLFNTNTFFNDPHTIILDDAHSAESVISDNWTINLVRYESEDQPLFDAICSILKDHIPYRSYERLQSEPTSSSDFTWIDTVPASIIYKLADKLNACITAYAGNTNHKYPWTFLKDHIHACNIYISHQHISIRPYMAPTFSHAPFENAKQRIYLSATPGEAGELERIFGRTNIKRINQNSETKQHAVGRRFFIFPELGLTEEEQIQFIEKIVTNERCLILAPNKKGAGEIISHFDSKTTIFQASDIERDKTEFVNTSPAAAVLANRYDGIDFPDDECRHSILHDIPTVSGHQDKFLIARLAANRAYDHRIVTRLIQAFGRCTRSTTDYSVVIVFGDKPINYLTKPELFETLHPELQSEINFGKEQSSGTSIDDLLENIEIFLDQGDDWVSVQEQIYEYRDDCTTRTLPGTTDLYNAAEHEVAFAKCIWNENFTGALESIKQIISHINDPSLRGMRAFWYYMAGSMSEIIASSSKTIPPVTAKQFYESAAKTAPSLSWLHSLKNSQPQETDGDSPKYAYNDLRQLDNLYGYLSEIGYINLNKFNKIEAKIRGNLATGKDFESAHKDLGDHIGFIGGKVETNGSPDPWWRVSDDCFIVFEDHANAQITSSLKVEKARQAATHPNWIREKFKLASTANITSVLITPVTQIDQGAACHLSNVKYWDLADFRDWATTALNVIRELHNKASILDTETWRIEALSTLRENGLTHEKIVDARSAAVDVFDQTKS